MKPLILTYDAWPEAENFSDRLKATFAFGRVPDRVPMVPYESTMGPIEHIHFSMS